MAKSEWKVTGVPFEGETLYVVWRRLEDGRFDIWRGYANAPDTAELIAANLNAPREVEAP
jgi:hypothetical protein